MQRYIVLLKFTEQGIQAVEESPNREQRFRDAAEGVGVNVEASFWTVGEFDGVVHLSAPDEASVSALVLSLSRAGNVQTQTMRAFTADEFRPIASRAASLM